MTLRSWLELCVSDARRIHLVKPTPTSSGIMHTPPSVLLDKLIINEPTQSALEFFPIHCPNGRLGQDMGFGGFAFALI